MSLTPAELLRVARLARLRIDEQEASHYASQLSNILGHFAAMGEVDTSSVEPLAHAIEVVGRTRADVVGEPIERELLQSGAPRTEGGYYLVPRVIE